MKYRYINADAKLSDKVSVFRMVAKSTFDELYNFGDVIRFSIPDNFVEERENGYYITDDERTLDELGAEVLVNIDGKWKHLPFDAKQDLYTGSIESEMSKLGYERVVKHSTNKYGEQILRCMYRKRT